MHPSPFQIREMLRTIERTPYAAAVAAASGQPPQSYQIPSMSQEFKRLQLYLTLGDPTIVLQSAFSLANPKMIQQFKSQFPMYDPIRLYATVPSPYPRDWVLLSFSPQPPSSVYQVEVLAAPGQMLVSQERDLSQLPAHFDSLVVTDMKKGAQEFILQASQYLCVNFMVTAKVSQGPSQQCQMCLLCHQQGVTRRSYFKSDVNLPENVETAEIYCQNDNLYLCSNCDKLIHHYALVQHRRLPIGEAARLQQCRIHGGMSLTVYNISANAFYCENCCLEQGIKIDGINVVRTATYAEELGHYEGRAQELQDTLRKLEVQISELQNFNEYLVKQYQAIELELLEQFKKLFLDLQREKSLAIQQNVGNVLLLQNTHGMLRKCVGLLLKPSTTNYNAYIQDVLAIYDIQPMNFVELRFKIQAFESCLKQHADALQQKFIQPVRENEVALNSNFQQLADLRNYGVQHTKATNQLYKVSTRELYTEEKFDAAVSQLQSEFTYSDIMRIAAQPASKQNAGQGEQKNIILKAGDKLADSEPTGIQLLQKMLQEQSAVGQSQPDFGGTRANRYEALFLDVKPTPYNEKVVGKVDFAEAPVKKALKSLPKPKSGQEARQEGPAFNPASAAQNGVLGIEQAQPAAPQRLLYSLQNGRSYAVMRKLCSGPVSLTFTLKGAALVTRTVQMRDFSDDFGVGDDGGRVQVIFNKKFIIIGDVCIFSDFAGAEIGQQQYEVVQFDVFSK